MEPTNERGAGFIWYELMTSDLDAAMHFYRAVVGWQMHDSGMGGPRYEIFGTAGKDLGGMMQWSSVGESHPPSWVGHVHTTDVDAESAAVKADGGAILRPPSDIPGVGRFAVVQDPQGASFLLFQPNQSEAPPRLKPHEPGAVAWHELGTTDREGAWAFYAKHYLWSQDAAVDMGPAGIYQLFSTNTGSGGMMTVPPEMRPPDFRPAWLFYFTVDGIQAAAKRVTTNGGRVTHGPIQVPGGGWILWGVDPQGAKFGLTSQT